MNIFQRRKEAFQLINSSREERERGRILTTSIEGGRGAWNDRGVERGRVAPAPLKMRPDSGLTGSYFSPGLAPESGVLGPVTPF